MKQFSVKTITLIFAFVLVLGACKKEIDPVNNPPKPVPVLVNTFQFILDSLPGLPKEPVANMYALFSVVNEKNEAVLTNKKLTLNYNGKFITGEMALPAGNYRVKKFLLVTGSNRIEYATPLVNSAKASLVKKALPFVVDLPQPVTKVLVTEVLKINKGDKSEDFGYPAGMFQETIDTTDEVKVAKSIRIRTSIRIGEVLYDSIPSSLMYRTWDANKDFKVRFIHLPAGTNTLKLDSTAVKHELFVTKWGQQYNLTLLEADIHNDELYVFGGKKDAKKLKSEVTYKLVNGKYVAESKASFEYSGNQLNKINYYRKRPDNSPYLAMFDEFEYSNNKVNRIKRFDESNTNSGSTTFTYNDLGLVAGIQDINQNIQTSVSIVHNIFPGTELKGVEMEYRFSNTSIGKRYYQRYENGNLKEDNSVTDNYSTETGVYTFDNNINPFIHIGWPNLNLSNQSKNNMTSQVKSYYGSYPLTVEYGFVYKYDDEGYPIELVKNHKSYVTGEFLYTSKTVYLY